MLVTARSAATEAGIASGEWTSFGLGLVSRLCFRSPCCRCCLCACAVSRDLDAPGIFTGLVGVVGLVSAGVVVGGLGEGDE
jgi:hypothetical protein